MTVLEIIKELQGRNVKNKVKPISVPKRDIKNAVMAVAEKELNGLVNRGIVIKHPTINSESYEINE